MSTTLRAATLPVSFFGRSADVVARDLLGALVMSSVGPQATAGRIVETEAYLGADDPASHGFRGRRNERNAALFGPPGSWYVYRSYGLHWCANLVCGPEGNGGAVLLRALEPLRGLEIMRSRRGDVDDRHLCSGPGKLCQALGITRGLDGLGMVGSPVVVAPRHAESARVLVTTRVGITKAAEWPLRFLAAGSPYVSRGPVSGRKTGSESS
ncbi:MAG: DNA-3-methyladenine glycosylase [Gemmatimonadales bacterium]